MQVFVAAAAQCDQVVYTITSRMAAECDVMKFKVGHRAAELAFPAITP